MESDSRRRELLPVNSAKTWSGGPSTVTAASDEDAPMRMSTPSGPMVRVAGSSPVRTTTSSGTRSATSTPANNTGSPRTNQRVRNASSPWLIISGAPHVTRAVNAGAKPRPRAVSVYTVARAGGGASCDSITPCSCSRRSRSAVIWSALPSGSSPRSRGSSFFPIRCSAEPTARTLTSDRSAACQT
jgi:hypothetical protein